MVIRKCFVPGLYQLRKGKLAGMAPKYLYIIHKGRAEVIFGFIFIHGGDQDDDRVGLLFGVPTRCLFGGAP